MDQNSITLKTVNAEELLELKKANSNLVVIDVRRIDEWKLYGIIEDSILLEFFDSTGNYDIESWLNKLSIYVTAKDIPFVIYCAHANRTKVIGNFLINELGYSNLYELDGGINYGWLDKGYKTVEYK